SSYILRRRRELSLRSANGSCSGGDRQALQEEFTALTGELNRIASSTTFGGRNLLDGSFQSTAFQVGSNANETISFGLRGVASTDLKGTHAAASATSGVAAGMSAKVTGDNENGLTFNSSGVFTAVVAGETLTMT